MISHVQGKAVAVDGSAVIVSVGGIGFSVITPHPHAVPLGSEIQLYAYLHWNAEQGPSLYGFRTSTERKIFLMVIGCSGIGPKIALAILGQLSPAAFAKAIAAGDLVTLGGVSGVGPKKAEQLQMQLKSKVAQLTDVEFDQQMVGVAWKDVSDALNSLNYSRPEISRALAYLQERNAGGAVAFDELLRQALSFLAKRL